jgi:decaprenylphospho-beta-D-erythro-pentofuranosid-2-ulose 2-reductase
VHLLILGANSEVARALAQKFAQAAKANLYMASRRLELLQAAARNIEIRFHVEAKPIFFDALDYASHAEFYHQLDPKPDGVILAFGYLGNQQKAQQDFAEARNIVATNFLGAVSILETIAADFERRGHGFIIGLSSVAGERGRQSNYIYGSAKGALTIYLSGLRHRLWRSGVRVITVLPGFIQTKMTGHLDLPARLTASPEEVAKDIFQAYRQGKDIVYTKWLWKWIMLIIRNIPEKLFVRTRL